MTGRPIPPEENEEQRAERLDHQQVHPEAEARKSPRTAEDRLAEAEKRCREAGDEAVPGGGPSGG